LFFFFFQAEDGIRDATVTGVQTCALPILSERYFRLCWLQQSVFRPAGRGHWGYELVIHDAGYVRHRSHWPQGTVADRLGGHGGEIGRASCRERGWGCGGAGAWVGERGRMR